MALPGGAALGTAGRARGVPGTAPVELLAWAEPRPIEAPTWITAFRKRCGSCPRAAQITPAITSRPLFFSLTEGLELERPMVEQALKETY
ncbi:unnamed protein product [Caretta caretta]